MSDDNRSGFYSRSQVEPVNEIRVLPGANPFRDLRTIQIPADPRIERLEADNQKLRRTLDAILGCLIYRENSEDFRVSFGRMTDKRFASREEAIEAIKREAVVASS